MEPQSYESDFSIPPTPAVLRSETGSINQWSAITQSVTDHELEADSIKSHSQAGSPKRLSQVIQPVPTSEYDSKRRSRADPTKRPTTAGSAKRISAILQEDLQLPDKTRQDVSGAGGPDREYVQGVKLMLILGSTTLVYFLMMLDMSILATVCDRGF